MPLSAPPWIIILLSSDCILNPSSVIIADLSEGVDDPDPLMIISPDFGFPPGLSTGSFVPVIFSMKSFRRSAACLSVLLFRSAIILPAGLPSLTRSIPANRPFESKSIMKNSVIFFIQFLIYISILSLIGSYIRAISPLLPVYIILQAWKL